MVYSENFIVESKIIKVVIFLMFYFMEGVVEGALPPKAFVATGHNH
jgi:hypothetical protein